jgi:subtilisin-like proprotein convertase family protein
MRPLRYSIAALLCALAIPAAAHATFVDDSASGGSVTFNDNAAATPYPSTILVEGADGPTVDVDVDVTLTHANTQDVDLALVSPSGAKSILMSDACGTGNMSLRSFTFDETLPATLAENSLCPAGTYLTTNYGSGDSWPAPGPGAGLSPNLDHFNGSSADGTWQLFALDDNGSPAGPQGSISSWGLEIITNTAEITVPDKPTTQGIADPYPSVKTFDTPDGEVIDDLSLNIFGFNHSFPRDVDLMLQGPTGETVMVMSDECSGDDIADNRLFTFDDEALVGLTMDPASCAASPVRPSDRDDLPENGPENLPAPAPPRPYGATMSVFDGLPGGTFRLFANDENTGDTGYIAGWSVAMTTRPPAATGFAATAVPAAEGETVKLTVNRTGSTNLGAATVDVAVNDGDTDSRDFVHAVSAKVQFARGEASKTIEIPINADFDAEGPETFQVALSNATGDAKLTEAAAFALVTIAQSAPDNRFTVGTAVRKRNGSAQIPVTIPGPGELTSDDAGSKDLLKTTDAVADKAGTTMLKVKPAKRTKRKLKRGKKVKVTAEITYKPSGGSANSVEAPVKLKLKRH